MPGNSAGGLNHVPAAMAAGGVTAALPGAADGGDDGAGVGFDGGVTDVQADSARHSSASTQLTDLVTREIDIQLPGHSDY